MYRKNLIELRIELDKKRCSSMELTEIYLKRIKKYDFLNSFIYINKERALEQAKKADKRISSGEVGPLIGLPIAHKDIFVTRDLYSTAGSKILYKYISPFDATIVKKLFCAGMICIGKTNMDEFAMGSSNENSFFGPVKNPWDYCAVSGGSSGGSAVAVANRLVPVATGSDTGGSIRQPSSFSGVTGIKPTYGLISRYGMISFSSSLDQCGPIACSSIDCALLLNEIVGFDKNDLTTLHRDKENYLRFLDKKWGEYDFTKPLCGLRIGIPVEYFNCNLNSEVGKCIFLALNEFKKLGADLVDINLPKTELSVPVYYIISSVEAASNLSKFDGIRYGYCSNKFDDIYDMYKNSRSEGFGLEVKCRILFGEYILINEYRYKYYEKAQRIRRMISTDFKKAFEKCDIIMGPVSPCVAWNIGNNISNTYSSDIYNLSSSLSGLPAMSIPCGFVLVNENKKRPVGLQIIGNYFDEARMLQISNIFQKVTNWHCMIPNDDKIL